MDGAPGGGSESPIYPWLSCSFSTAPGPPGERSRFVLQGIALPLEHARPFWRPCGLKLLREDSFVDSWRHYAYPRMNGQDS